MTSKLWDNLHFDLMILLMLCENVCLTVHVSMLPPQDCCGNCSDSEEEPTRLWRRGLAVAPPLHHWGSHLFTVLHICIFKIALYKHWNVYFHYIVMQCILFKVIEMKRTEKRVPVIVLYHVWRMERTDRLTLLKSHTRLTQLILYILSVCLAASLRFFFFCSCTISHTCTVCTLNICFRHGEQRKFAFADIFIFIFWILFSYGNLDNQMTPFV